MAGVRAAALLAGPVWLIVNWMLIEGLRRNGRPDLAERIRRDSLALVERAGFAEYFNSLTGEPLGGPGFPGQPR